MSDESLESMLRNAFAVESAELLERLSAQLAQLDRETIHPDEHPNEPLRQMSITLHTLTGASLTTGLETVSLLCQTLEDFVDELTHGNRPPNEPAIESLRQACRLLGDVCRGGSTARLADVLHSLRTTPGWHPHGVELHRTAQRPPADAAVPDIHRVMASGAASGPARLDSDDEPSALDTRARAARSQFDALYAAWQELRQQLTDAPQAPESPRPSSAAHASVNPVFLDQLSARFDDTLHSFHGLTEEVIYMNAEAPSTGVRPAQTPTAQTPTAHTKALESRHERILVVDDSRTARIWIRDLLESVGYTVYVATDGQEAFEIIPSLVQLDLLVTDVKMPRMDGVTLCHRVRGNTEFARMPIVIVTSQNDDSAIEAGLNAGADAYIVKQDLARQHFLKMVGWLLDGIQSPAIM